MILSGGSDYLTSVTEQRSTNLWYAYFDRGREFDIIAISMHCYFEKQVNRKIIQRGLFALFVLTQMSLRTALWDLIIHWRQ